jgi:hypothetical protein
MDEPSILSILAIGIFGICLILWPTSMASLSPCVQCKVKAHCGKHDLCQDPFLTESNSCTRKLAKDTAWAFLETRHPTACEEHLVHTLATRSSSFKMLPVEIPVEQDFFSPMQGIDFFLCVLLDPQNPMFFERLCLFRGMSPTCNPCR